MKQENSKSISSFLIASDSNFNTGKQVSEFQKDITKISNILWEWIKTWKRPDSAFNGFVIHRFNQMRMFHLHDTAWTQSALINAFINLYRNSGDKKWLDQARKASKLELKRLDLESGEYRYAGHEDDRFTSLVHCAMANNALINLAENINDSLLKEQIIKAVRICVKRYFIEKLWVENFGAFKVSKIDYYSNMDRFVLNMNSLAMKSLIGLSQLIQTKDYDYYIKKISDWILDRQILKQDTLNGSFPYQETSDGHITGGSVAIYSALTGEGLIELYYYWKDQKVRNSLAKLAEHFYRFRDKRFGLFFHRGYTSLDKYPLFVAGAGIILRVLEDIKTITNKEYDFSDSVENLLKMQKSNGSFPAFIGHNQKAEGSLIKRIWKDYASVVSWNANMFEFLSKNANMRWQQENISKSVDFKLSSNFIYLETRQWVFILSFFPIKEAGIHFMNKKLRLSLISLTSRNIKRILIENINS